MARHTFQRDVELPVSAEQALAWHERPGAFERLIPPWRDVRVVEQQGTVRDGDRRVLRIRMGPRRVTWEAKHHSFIEGRQFCDRQERGPFAFWDHAHRFEPLGPDRCRLIDRIEYEPPLRWVGEVVINGAICRRLEQVFAYRHDVIRHDLALHATFAGRPRQTVAVSGSTGLIGSALGQLLTSGGHTLVRLVRREKPGVEERQVTWDVQRGLAEPKALEGVDAVVHLAGESIAGGRWTQRRMKAIRDSRVVGTRKLVESLGRMAQPPRTLICASAVGIYGDRGDEVLDETSAPGQGFLAEVGQGWEAAAREAEQLGIRVVLARLGVVLSPRGGALKQMLVPFKLGLGGPVGHGRQYMSVISLDDAISAIYFALMRDDARGPINLVADAVTSRAFAHTLGQALRRPALMPMPASVLRAVFGKMADEALLASARVRPAALRALDYRFRHPTLADMLAYALGVPPIVQSG